MNQTELRAYLDGLVETMRTEDRAALNARLGSLASAFPFNEYEYIIAFLSNRGILSFSEYETLRESYVSANRYLNLFELPPRTFGQGWAERHLQDLDDSFRTPNRELDPQYDVEYDLWRNGVKIEVKSSRAADASRQGALASRALRWGDNAPFWMNYQQLKADICDVFILVGVWLDKIAYWVMSNDDIKSHPLLSPQHRDGSEYQIGIRNSNIGDFEIYRVEADSIAQAVIEKARRP